jgi:hypothetical protein
MSEAVDSGVAADLIEQRIARLHALLWPPGEKPVSVWAVLDAARSPAVYAALIESRLEFRCLYEGPIPRELERVAPQLVELLPNHRLARRLLGPAWGGAWGVLLRIEDPSNLRHHLRKLLKVKTEDGRTLLFRWYDPRVLRVYAPTCTAREWQQFNGPVAGWMLEGAAADSAQLLSTGRSGEPTLRSVPLG